MAALGSQAIASFSDVTDAGVCGRQCDKEDSCKAFSFNQSGHCVLWEIVNGTRFNTEESIFFRICKDTCAGQPVKRGEEKKDGSDKPVSIAKWTQGKHNRSKDT